MSFLADLLSTVFERRYRAGPTAQTDSRPIEELAAALVGSQGEMSGLALAQQILVRFNGLDDAEKLALFHHLERDMDIDPDTVREALAAYEHAPTKDSYRSFMEASEPRRQELIRRLNSVPGATGQLVRMRADLLRLGRGDPTLEPLDLDFRHLFASWFNRGFLVLRPISWQSPAYILDKIIAYEAVHAIDSWDDLRGRLQPADRRCFAFFHPSMPDEPLIFVEVALTRGIPGSVQDLLAGQRKILPATEADTACFYSISNCQAGLAKISFGNLLIKQVAADLAAELPGLATFVTLSPIPGLARWARDQKVLLDGSDDTDPASAAAHFLLKVKAPDGGPSDPVARFHLGNGALIHAIHTGADTSAKGMAQSAGVMVNYLYDLDKVTRNHEKFATERAIAASPEVTSLAAGHAPARPEES